MPTTIQVWTVVLACHCPSIWKVTDCMLASPFGKLPPWCQHHPTPQRRLPVCTEQRREPATFSCTPNQWGRAGLLAAARLVPHGAVISTVDTWIDALYGQRRRLPADGGLAV